MRAFKHTLEATLPQSQLGRTPLLGPGFYHRRNIDGSWDSICLTCYLPVMNSKSEVELAEAEHHHDCDTFWAAR